jgi:hypothetical protein
MFFVDTTTKNMSSFQGRKIYNMYMGNMMLRHNNKEHVFLPRKKDLLHVHGKHDAETQQQRTCLPSKEERSITCTWET